MSDKQTGEKGHIDLAMDAHGNRYTSHAFGFDGDPWRGAIILTPGVVRDLRERGLLPLTEVALPPADRGAS